MPNRDRMKTVLVLVAIIGAFWLGYGIARNQPQEIRGEAGHREAWAIAPCSGSQVTSLQVDRVVYPDGRVVQTGPAIPRGGNGELLVPSGYWIVSVGGHTYYLSPAK
jgi:hypothetical protein